MLRRGECCRQLLGPLLSGCPLDRPNSYSGASLQLKRVKNSAKLQTNHTNQSVNAINVLSAIVI